MSDSDDVSVLSEDDYSGNNDVTAPKRVGGRRTIASNGLRRGVGDDDSSSGLYSDEEDDGGLSVDSFGGGSNEEGNNSDRRRGRSSIRSSDSFGGEDLGQSADDLIEKVEEYLRDYDGPIEEDEELMELRAALKEAQESLEQSRQAAAAAEEERQQEIENTKQNIRRIQRMNLERQESIEESSITSKKADEKRHSLVDADLEELDRSGHEMKQMNEKFQKQKQRVKRKTKKREALAQEMKLGAKKAMRRLRMVDVRARISREEAEKAAKQKAKVQMDMTEPGRRERVHGYYMRYAMPKRSLFEEQIKKLPASAGTTVDDVALLPWDERGFRVNVGKLNKVMCGLAEPDW